jgi:aspartyl-tRNA(Asn)/glutamyl-tRNA(Gln) amidotransferase subunit A
VKRRIMIGTYVLSAASTTPISTGAEGPRADLARFRAGVRAVRRAARPDRAVAASALGEKSDDPIAMYLNDVFSVPASSPASRMSVPAGLGQGLPLGLQIIGKPLDEQGVLKPAGDRAAGRLPLGGGVVVMRTIASRRNRASGRS